MKKSATFFSILACTILFASCSLFHTITTKDMMSIQEGMSREEVISIMGTPNYRSFHDGYEEIEYNAGYQSSADYITIIRITLLDGKVTAMESFPIHSPRDKKTPPQQTK